MSRGQRLVPLVGADRQRGALPPFPTRRSSDLFCTNTVHGNGQCTMRLVRDGSERHCTSCKTFEDFTCRFHLLQRNGRSEEHTPELQSRENLVCRLLPERKNTLV